VCIIEIQAEQDLPPFERFKFELNSINRTWLDVRDGDGIPHYDGPPPCAPGQTTDCVDNCRFFPNPGQADDDGDGVGNACDACPEWPNALTLVDTDGDGIPDDCQCGDFDADGFLTGSDARNINKCSTGSLPEDQCPLDLLDVNNDGRLTGSDARDVNKGSTGSLETYQLRCPRRPHGEPPPILR
jgi:hypothetical protein